ncbi:MAG: (5-formylfuran-3-yl)methyl phosphate synthase [Nitrospirota bacterium]
MPRKYGILRDYSIGAPGHLIEKPSSFYDISYDITILMPRNRLSLRKKTLQKRKSVPTETVLFERRPHKRIPVSTNIGEVPGVRASSCQAALGVATAGADIVKCGMAELCFKPAVYLGNQMVRSIKKFYRNKKVVPAVFLDEDMRRYFDPFEEGPALVKEIKADGILIDTFNKSVGKRLLDYCTTRELKVFAKKCHKAGKEAWIAGSITKEELPELWPTNVDVICVRGAACEKKGKGRFGEVKTNIVAGLVATMP